MSYVDPHRGGVSGTYGPNRNILFPRTRLGLPEDPIPPEKTQPIPFLEVDGEAVRRENSDFYAAVQRLDTGVGEFIETLDELLDPGNTLVTFTGDHGPDVTRGKIAVYATATHVPLILRWPATIEAGQVRDELVSTVDLFPTFLNAAGSKTLLIDNRQTGRSLLELFPEAPHDWRRYLFTEFITHVPWHFYPRYAVIDGDFQYIHNLFGGERKNPLGPTNYCEAWRVATAPRFSDPAIAAAYARVDNPPRHELFNLQSDPHLIDNLADDPAYAAKLRELSDAVKTWREETKDPFLDPAFRDAFEEKTKAMLGEYRNR